mgnify:CR=1 FL=1
MPAYIIKSEATITRQEGDTSEIKFIIPNVFPLYGEVFELIFAVYSRSGTRQFIKTTLNGDFVIDAQTATTYLQVDNTKGIWGTYRWELQYRDAGSITTIGKGNFEILKELIP